MTVKLQWHNTPLLENHSFYYKLCSKHVFDYRHVSATNTFPNAYRIINPMPELSVLIVSTKTTTHQPQALNNLYISKLLHLPHVQLTTEALNTAIKLQLYDILLLGNQKFYSEVVM
jgi:hypothetical protein